MAPKPTAVGFDLNSVSRDETRSSNLLVAAHAEAVSFRNNTIVPAQDYVTGRDDAPAFTLENSQDVTIEGNDNQLPSPLKLKADSRSRRVKMTP